MVGVAGEVEIGAENGHCRATSTFLLTNGDKEQFSLVFWANSTRGN